VILETDPLDNVAQSNYLVGQSGHLSPSDRKRTNLTVSNPYPGRIVTFLQVRQSNPLFRVFLGSRWLVLAPGESRTVELMFEYAGDDIVSRPGGGQLVELYQGQPNKVIVQGYSQDLETRAPVTGFVEAVTYPTGGAEALVTHGYRTTTTLTATRTGNGQIHSEGNVFLGSVASPAPDGTVLISYYGPHGTAEQITRSIGGRFEAMGEDGDWTHLDAYYLAPDNRFTDSQSARLDKP